MTKPCTCPEKLYGTTTDNIPSREWLLGWFNGYSCGKNQLGRFNTKKSSRESLYETYLKIKGNYK